MVEQLGPWHITSLDIGIRILVALVLGGLIGFERELSSHAAGFRTHILVCLGSTLIMLLSIYGFSGFTNEPNVRMDPSRLAAQVVSGIGFLGAGTIIRNGMSVTGLTTAASLWVVAAIGLAVGAGFYVGATLTSALVILSLWTLNKVEHRYFSAKKRHVLKIRAMDQPGILARISHEIEHKKGEIRKIGLGEEEDDDGERTILISYTIHIGNYKAVPTLLEDIRHLPGVLGLTME